MRSISSWNGLLKEVFSDSGPQYKYMNLKSFLNCGTTYTKLPFLGAPTEYWVCGKRYSNHYKNHSNQTEKKQNIWVTEPGALEEPQSYVTEFQQKLNDNLIEMKKKQTESSFLFKAFIHNPWSYLFAFIQLTTDHPAPHFFPKFAIAKVFYQLRG